MIKKLLKSQKGLTLIELLAVIVILGIIAAIAVPSIGGIINKTKGDAVRADAIQVLDAAKLYVSSEAPTVSTDFTSSGVGTAGALDQYLDNIGTYKITVTLTNGKYVYSAIEAKKDGYTITGCDEEHLLDKELSKTDKKCMPTKD